LLGLSSAHVGVRSHHDLHVDPLTAAYFSAAC
jgi:hypothetical protein